MPYTMLSAKRVARAGLKHRDDAVFPGRGRRPAQMPSVRSEELPEREQTAKTQRTNGRPVAVPEVSGQDAETLKSDLVFNLFLSPLFSNSPDFAISSASQSGVIFATALSARRRSVAV